MDDRTGATRRSAALAAACAVAVIVGACGDSDADGNDDGREVATLASLGDVPDPVADAEDAELLSCEIDEDARYPAVTLEGIITNNRSFPVWVDPVVTVRLRDELVSREDERLHIGTGLGPGRQMRIRQSFRVNETRLLGTPTASCELSASLRGEMAADPLRASNSDAGGPEYHRFDPDDIEVAGCRAGDEVQELRVTNPTDEPIGLTLVVEHFEGSGLSAGTQEITQWPEETFRQEPMEDRAGLGPGATGVYELHGTQRAENWGAIDGPITGCEVIDARYVIDPEPHTLIID